MLFDHIRLQVEAGKGGEVDETAAVAVEFGRGDAGYVVAVEAVRVRMGIDEHRVLMNLFQGVEV